MSRDPSEEFAEAPRAKQTYERHHREPPKDLPEEHSVAIDPVQWRPVRIGLNLVWWGSLTILAALIAFILFWLLNLFFFKADPSVVHIVGWNAGGIAFLGAVVTFAGQCTCVMVPRPAQARLLILGSIVGMIGTMVATAMVLFSAPAVPGDLQANPPQAEPPKEVAATKEDVPAKEEGAIPAGEATARAAPPGWILIARRAKAPILVAYLLGQLLFILFLKRVAHFFHDNFLAESTGSYLAFLIVHTGLATLLPPPAMVACFTWVILLGLEFVLMTWFLILVAATRRAIV